MEPVTNKLRRTRLFANLPDAGLAELVTDPGLATGEALEEVPARPGDLVVLLEGGIHMLARDGSGDHLAILAVDEGAPEPAILYTIPPAAVLKLTRTSVYLVIAGERLDTLLAERQESASLAQLDDGTRARVAALITSAPFKRLAFDRLVRCAEAMQSWPVSAGEDIIVEGGVGDYFYVLEQGTAEVVRQAPGERSRAVQPLAMLAAGATFGEEALLQGSPRNATVRMRSDGRVLRLAKADFDHLLKDELVREIESAKARALVQAGRADVVDCRSEEEWELWRLPRARLMPLETIRERARGLDQKRTYLLYCRNGRRSATAAFLMRQHGLDAWSLAGGISAWPFEVEGVPV